MQQLFQGHTKRHDPDSWDFEIYLERPEVHLANTLKTQWPLMHYLMFTEYEDPILEVGAGSGRGSILIKRLQPHREVVALDASVKACSVMQRYSVAAKTPIKVVQADALTIPFPDKYFGVAFSVGLLEHYPDEWIIAALKEQCRVARAVMFNVPTDFYLSMFRTVHGDERGLTKMEWLKLATRVAPIMDITFHGLNTEEYAVTVVLWAGKGK